MKTFSRNFYGVWLGLSLGISGIFINDYKFWLIIIPTILLVEISHNKYD